MLIWYATVKLNFDVTCCNTYRKPTGIKYKRVLSPSPSGQPWTFPSGVTSRKYLGPVSLPRHSNLVLTPFSCGSENKNFHSQNFQSKTTHFWQKSIGTFLILKFPYPKKAHWSPKGSFLPFLRAFPTELFLLSNPPASEIFLMDTLSGIFTPHRFWIKVWMKIEKMMGYMEFKSNYLKPMKLTKIKNNPIYHSKSQIFLKNIKNRV